MRPLASTILGFCLVLIPVYCINANADIYSWKDPNGKTHFTDDPAQIPRLSRDELRRIPEDKVTPKPLSSEPEPDSEITGLYQDVGETREFSVPIVKVLGGNYVVKALLNEQVEVNLMIDTGASNVSISRKVAEKLGLDDFALDYGPQTAANTANGRIFAPLIVLDSIQLQRGVSLRHVETGVLDNFDGDGLLGMNVLGEFNFNIDSATSSMILKPLEKSGELVWGGRNALWWKNKFTSFSQFFLNYQAMAADMRKTGEPKAQNVKKMADHYRNQQIKLQERAAILGVPKELQVNYYVP